MINNPLNVPIRLRTTLDSASARSALRQLQDMLSRGINLSDTILGAANPNTHWRSRGAGYQSLAYMDRAIMGRGGMPGMLGRLGAGMFGFGGGVNSLPAMAVSAVETARNQEQAYSDLNRRVGESIQTYARFREEVIATGREIGLTRQQILSLTDAYVSGVGKMNSSVMSSNLRGAMNLGKGLGIDPTSLVGAMTGAQRAGIVPVGGSTQPIMAAIATAIGMGGMGGRENEVVKAIDDLTQLLAGRLPTVSEANFQTVGALMTVMNASGNQGLMGSRGEALIGGLDTWIQGKGGGATKNLLFMAMQQQRARQGQSPLDLLGLELSSEQGVGSAFNLKAVANMFGPGGMAPGGPMAPLLMKYLGITQTASQAQAFLPALQAVAGGAGGGFEAVSAAMGKSGINNAAMPFAVRILAGNERIQTVLDDFASMMTPSERGAFQKQAAGITDPQKAVELLGQFGDKTDRLLTQQDKATLAMTNFSNSLIDLATKMLPAVTGSLYAMTGIVNILGGGLAALNSVVDMAAVTFGAVAAVSGLQVAATGIKAVSGISSLFSKAAIGPTLPGIPNIGGTSAAGRAVRGALSMRGVGGAIKASLPMALAFGALDAYQGISNGQDPMYAVGRSIFGMGGSILGGIAGGALFAPTGPGAIIGAAGGSVAGGMGADWLYTKLFGDGMKIQGDDKLAKDDTLKQLLSFLQSQQAQADAAQALLNPGMFDQGNPWGPGGYLDESTRAANRRGTGGSSSGGFSARATAAGHQMSSAMARAMGVVEGPDAWRAFAAQVDRELGASPNSAGAIANNPFNLHPLGGGRMWPGQIGTYNTGTEILARFGSSQQGVMAAMSNYLGGSYDNVLAAFRTGSPSLIATAIQNSPWAGSHYGNNGSLAAAAMNGSGITVTVSANPLTINVPNGSGGFTTYQTQLTATYKPSNR